MVHAESLFLEMFEDEFAEFEHARLSLESLGAEMLLRPAESPLSGLGLHKRNPSGNEERIRVTIQHYLHMRKLVLDLRGQSETELPLKVEQTFVDVSDCINLRESLVIQSICRQQRSTLVHSRSYGFGRPEAAVPLPCHEPAAADPC